MPKTGLKTFVYSFSVSLLTIFCVNGAYWHSQHPSEKEIVISDKNITLFLNRRDANPSVRPVPVKKIALTVLPGQEKKPPQDQNLSVEDNIILADNFDPLEIPLEFGGETAESLQFAENLDQPPVLPPTREYSTPSPELPAPPLPPVEAKRLPERPPLADGAKPVVAPVPELKEVTPEIAKTPEAAPIPVTDNSFLTNAKKVNESPTVVADKSFAEKPSKPVRNKQQAKVMAEVDEPESEDIPLLRIRDIWAGKNQNIKLASSEAEQQVALADRQVPINSMKTDDKIKDGQKNKPLPEDQWVSMDQSESSAGNPWVVATTAVASRKALTENEKYFQADEQSIKEALGQKPAGGKGVKVASETVKNLLIPIPEDILNDENLTPQLVSSNKKDEVAKEKELDKQASRDVPTRPLLIKREEPRKETQTVANEKDSERPEEKKKNLLNSLSSIFSSSGSGKKSVVQRDDDSIFSSLKRKAASKNRVKIMPTEMRLSFQPNRAEISGQTLRWIQAFAVKATEDNNMVIEIRIDGTTSSELQQKRLNLLHNILTNKGVEYSKINTVFTTREPNSFIIRTVKLTNINTVNMNGRYNRAADGYYLQW